MADDKASEGSEESEEELRPGGPSKLPVVMAVLIGINSLLTAGVLAVVLLKEPAPSPMPAGNEANPGDGDGPADAKAKAEAEPELDENGDPVPRKKKAIRGPIEKLQDIVIQLRNPEFDRFARISFELELASDDDLEFVQAYKPRIRDSFIAWLADRSYEELRGSRGLAKMKKVLSARAEEICPGDRIKALYITNFVVQ